MSPQPPAAPGPELYESSFLTPLRGTSGISSVLFPFPFPGCDQVGGDPKQDLLWEWAESKEPRQPSPACAGTAQGEGAGRGGRGPWKTVPAPRPGGPVGGRSWEPCPGSPRSPSAGRRGCGAAEGAEADVGPGGRRQLLQCSGGPDPARRLGAGRRQAAGGRAQAEGGPGRAQGRRRPSPARVAEGGARPPCTDEPASSAGRPRGYFFLGKKLNLFSFSFLPRLASGPVLEGRGRLCALTRMLWDSLMAVLTPCSQDSISSCRVGGLGPAKHGVPLGQPLLRKP